MACQRGRHQRWHRIPYVTLLIAVAAVENEAIIKRLKSRCFPHGNGSIIPVVRETARTRIAKMGGDCEAHAPWMQSRIRLAEVAI